MEHLILNLVPSGVAPEVHASQFDNGRVIRFDIMDGTTPYTLSGAETITAAITRADGTQDTLNVANTSSTYIDVVTEEDTCPVSGLYGCEITITDGADVIGSQNFILKVEKDPYDNLNIRIVTVGPADICTFETTLPEPLQSVLVDVVATGGNGTPDNPNPIVGYSSANITRCGVNLWDEQWVVANEDINTTTGEIVPTYGSGNIFFRSKNFIPIEAGKTYFDHNGMLTVGNYRLFYYDINKNYLSYVSHPNNTTFTTPVNTRYMLFRFSATADTVYQDNISINSISTDTQYHPYNGNTFTIAFGQTVYGGSLDVTRGKLHVTWFDVDLGSLNWIKGGNNFISDALPNALKRTSSASVTANMLCDCLVVSNQSNYAQTNNSIAYYYTGSDATTSKVICNSTDYASADDFKTAVDGYKLAYELATPFDIDLTPVQIRVLVGENNVFADCGQTTVEYLDEE